MQINLPNLNDNDVVMEHYHRIQASRVGMEIKAEDGLLRPLTNIEMWILHRGEAILKERQKDALPGD